MGTWTNEEIEQYIQMRIQILDPLYSEENLSPNNPHARAQYLQGRLQLTISEQELISRTILKEGRALALKKLESWMLVKINP